jgi:hypothetical protein
MRRVIDVALRAARADANGTFVGIDAYALHHAHVDDQPVLDTAQTRSVVATTADRHAQAVFSGELHRGDDIGHVGAPGDQARVLVDHAVVERAGGVVALVPGLEQPAAEMGPEVGDPCCVKHGVLPAVIRGVSDHSVSAKPCCGMPSRREVLPVRPRP